MPGMAAEAAVAEGQRHMTDQHALRGHVIRKPALRTFVIGAERFRFAEQCSCLRHLSHGVCILRANAVDVEVSRISLNAAAACATSPSRPQSAMPRSSRGTRTRRGQ